MSVRVGDAMFTWCKQTVLRAITASFHRWVGRATPVSKYLCLTAVSSSICLGVKHMILLILTGTKDNYQKLL